MRRLINVYHCKPQFYVENGIRGWGGGLNYKRVSMNCSNVAS